MEQRGGLFKESKQRLLVGTLGQVLNGIIAIAFTLVVL